MKPKYIFAGIIILIANLPTIAQTNSRDTTLSADKREKYIQAATQLRKDEDYIAAVSNLDSILSYNPADAQILLFKGDLLLQAKKFSDATNTYKLLLPLNYEPTITKINLSYALFMSHKPAFALDYAKKAWEQNKTNSNAVVNFFNAMLWNIKTKDASKFLQKQDSLLSPAQRLVLKARLYTTSGNYKQGLSFYNKLVKQHTEKYYVLEYAEVLLGKKEYAKSAEIMQQSKDLFTANEYNAYLQKLKATTQQNVGSEMVFFKDIAQNLRIENNFWWQQNEIRKYRFRLSVGNAIYKSADSENYQTTAQFAQIHIDERWSLALTGESDLNLQLISPAKDTRFSGITGRQSIKYQPNDRRMVGVYYSTDILNFTASLFGKNIRSNNLGYITHIMVSGKTGIYSQGSAGKLTDNNERYQFFGSLYQLLRTEPTLKTGINFSALHFTKTNIDYYFSPNQYLNTEIFLDYSTPLPMLSKFYLQAQAAGGLQKIETKAWEPALRLQTEVGIRLPHFETGLKYQTSNVASANGTGYSFNWYTLRVLWRW